MSITRLFDQGSTFATTPRRGERDESFPMPVRRPTDPAKFIAAMDANVAAITTEIASQRLMAERLGGRWDDEDESLMQDFRAYADECQEAGSIVLALQIAYQRALMAEIIRVLREKGLTKHAEAYRRGDVSSLGLGRITL